MGGSQGASGINQAMIKALPFLRNAPLQVIHLSGTRDERLVADNYRRENIPAHVAAFHHRMEEAYSAADLVVARAGAASLAEFAAFSLPGILIPFPYATDDHQTRNAEIYAHVQAAILLKGVRGLGRVTRAQNSGVDRGSGPDSTDGGEFLAPRTEKRGWARRDNHGEVYDS